MKRTIIYGGIWIFLSAIFISGIIADFITLDNLTKMDDKIYCYNDVRIMQPTITNDEIPFYINWYQVVPVCFGTDINGNPHEPTFWIEYVNTNYADIGWEILFLIIIQGLWIRYLISNYKPEFFQQFQIKVSN